MINESSVLNMNLSLIVVDEHHTVKLKHQNTPTFNLQNFTFNFIMQIQQKSEESLCW